MTNPLQKQNNNDAIILKFPNIKELKDIKQQTDEMCNKIEEKMNKIIDKIEKRKKRQ